MENGWMTWVLGAFLMIAVVLAAVYLSRGILMRAASAGKPKYVGKATVVGRRVEGRPAVYKSNQPSFAWVTFKLEDGSRTELMVHGRESAVIKEGQRGALTFQGIRFIRFVKDA